MNKKNTTDTNIEEEQKKINRIFKEVKAEAIAIDIPVSKYIDENIVINRRAKGRFGCCRRLRKSGGITPHTIEISVKLIEAPERSLRSTLAHEILHTCEGCHDHHVVWKTYAERMNKAYGYNIKRTSTPEELGILEKDKAGKISEAPKAKYVLICTKCNAKIERIRETKVVKYPQLYRCKCGGMLKRIQ